MVLGLTIAIVLSELQTSKNNVMRGYEQTEFLAKA